MNRYQAEKLTPRANKSFPRYHTPQNTYTYTHTHTHTHTRIHTHGTSSSQFGPDKNGDNYRVYAHTWISRWLRLNMNPIITLLQNAIKSKLLEYFGKESRF